MTEHESKDGDMATMSEVAIGTAEVVPDRVLEAICACGCPYRNHESHHRGINGLYLTGPCMHHEDCIQFRMPRYGGKYLGVLDRAATMEWVKAVTIVFDSTYPVEQRGVHNGNYQAVEARLRSDGKMFYLGKHSKATLDGMSTLERSNRQWEEFLREDSIDEPVTEAEFLLHLEQQRVNLNGAYL